MERAERHNPMPGARFVDPKVLARIGSLELLARTVVDGFINGLHRSPYFGASVDFAEHRGYVAGDDIRRIDWRLYARTDRYFVKQYEADSNANVSVLLDVSRSMGYGSGGITKLDYARYLAGCLTYFAHRQRDRVGIVTFDDEIVDYVPASAKHLELVLHTLDRSAARRPGRLGPPLRKMAEHFGRRGILVLISDLYDDAGGGDGRGEAAPVPGQRPHRLSRAGSGRNRLPLRRRRRASRIWRAASRCRSCRPRSRTSIARSYANTWRRWGPAVSENRIDYTLFGTATPLDYALFKYLSARQRVSRVR